MMDLIDRKAAIDVIDHEREMLINQGMAGAEHVVVHHARRLIEDIPHIPAVPLDKLCKWLAENSMNIPCASCQHMSNDYCTAIGDMSKPCPKDADDWRKALTNWMEGLHAAD